MALLLQLTQKLAQGFQALWVRYPNKNSKADAEKAYSQVVKTPEIDDQVHQALDWQLPYWESLEWYHPPYLATYLRKGRYLDERPTPPKPKLPPPTRFAQLGAAPQANDSEALRAARARLAEEWGESK